MLRAMSVFDDLTPDELRMHTQKVFRVGRGTRPEATLVEIGGQRAVLKDFGRSDPWFSWLLGRLMAYREARALRLLDGVPGVPRLLRRVTPQAVLMEYIDGRPAKDIPRGELDAAVFERIHALVQGRRWNRFWRWAFRRFCEADRIGVARLKRRLAPALLTEEDQDHLVRDKRHPLARAARFVGGSIREISRFFLTRNKSKPEK